MKKTLFAAAAVLLAFSFTSCKKETPDAIVKNETPELAPTPSGNPPVVFEYTLRDGDTWIIGAHAKNGEDLTANYEGYEFVFQLGEVVTATNRDNTIDGSWTIDGSNLVINFEDPTLSALNGIWPINSQDEKTMLLNIDGTMESIRLDVKE